MTVFLKIDIKKFALSQKNMKGSPYPHKKISWGLLIS